MNITITGRHMEMTDAIKGHVESGLQKVRAHFDKVIDVDVILTVEKHRQIAEINLRANGLRINAQESSDDLYGSVDSALTKLERQVDKYKGRIHRHQPRSVREAKNYVHKIIELEQSAIAEHDGDYKHKVITHKDVPLVSMMEEDAALQLELIEDPFFVFLHSDTNKISIIYKHGDGTYGVIEPHA